MSAFMCADEQFSVLAKKYADMTGKDPAATYRTLAGANKTAVDFRYKDAAGELYDADSPLGAGYTEPACPDWSADELAIIAESFEYQACEDPTWAKSKACRISTAIIEDTIGASAKDPVEYLRAQGRAKMRANSARAAAGLPFGGHLWSIGPKSESAATHLRLNPIAKTATAAAATKGKGTKRAKTTAGSTAGSFASRTRTDPGDVI